MSRSFGNSSARSLVSQTASLRGSPGSSIDLILATLVINILGLALPLTLMQVYDRIIPNQALTSLSVLVIGCSLAIFLESILKLCREQVSSWLGARYEHFLNCKAVERILTADLEEVERENVAVHMDSVKSISTLRNFYCNQFFLTFLDLPFAAIYLATIWYLSPKLAYLVLAIVGGMFISTILFLPLYRSAKNQQAIALNSKLNFVIQAISKIHFIKAFAQEERMNVRFQQHQSDQSRYDFKVSLLQTLPSNTGMLFAQGTLFTVIGFGAEGVASGHMTLGVLTACMMLGVRTIQPTQSLASYLFKSPELKLAKSKVLQILELPRAEQYRKPRITGEIEGSIEFEQVSFRQPGKNFLALDELSFVVAPGEFVGITASNSIGAPALLSLLTGFERPLKGRVLIDGLDISRFGEEDLNRFVGLLTSSPHILKGTVIENIAMFNPARYALALETASMLKLDERVAQLPEGFHTELGLESVSTLPATTIQMVALARLLVVRPRILLFGEADAGFDDGALDVFEEVLMRLKGSSTIILVTDQQKLLAHADRIQRVADGKLTGTSRYSLLPDSRETQVKVWVT